MMVSLNLSLEVHASDVWSPFSFRKQESSSDVTSCGGNVKNVPKTTPYPKNYNVPHSSPSPLNGAADFCHHKILQRSGHLS